MGLPRTVNSSDYGRGPEQQRIDNRNGRIYYVHTRNGIVTATHDTERPKVERVACLPYGEIWNIEVELSKIGNESPIRQAGFQRRIDDIYQAYRHLGRRLRCWAHLERKLRGLTESTDARIADTGNDMLGGAGQVEAAIYLARSKPPEAKGVLAGQYANDIALLRTLCEQHREDTHDKLRQIAVEFLLDWEVILRQVAEPHLPLMNNAAEIALRHWVIARRLSYGTRSEAGTRAFALLASVNETCRKRGASFWVFIASVIAAARNGLELPSLPSIPQGA